MSASPIRKTRTILVTANDTDAGKTWVVGSLARMLAADGQTVQIVKPVQCGLNDEGRTDAESAGLRADATGTAAIRHYTLFQFSEPLAPLATQGGKDLTLELLVAAVNRLPHADWRIIEGAGGVTVPLDRDGSDWSDFAHALGVHFVIGVVDNRLGAINQSRLLASYLRAHKLQFALWLNAVKPLDPAVLQSNRDALASYGLRVLAWQNNAAPEPETFDHELFWRHFREGSTPPFDPKKETASAPPEGETHTDSICKRLEGELFARESRGLRRQLPTREATQPGDWLNLADNDYLRLSQHPEVKAAAIAATEQWGASSSASPLITGHTEAHAELTERLCRWHNIPHGMVWNSGYAANQAVLSGLPDREDLIIADRLIHNSMVSGILRSGARFIRYRHCDLDHLEGILRTHGHNRRCFVVTESVFSMDGDFPDLAAMAALRQRYGFCWIVDEAHALGWYGNSGAGLVEQAGVAAAVDILVGTLGKGLGASGAYTLFQRPVFRDYLINFADEFVYSTYLPPASAAAACTAIHLCCSITAGQREAIHLAARAFRQKLQQADFALGGMPDGDSPIVPIVVGEAQHAVQMAEALLARHLRVCAIRPPTVPRGSSRLRISLNSQLTPTDYDRLFQALLESRSELPAASPAVE